MKHSNKREYTINELRTKRFVKVQNENEINFCTCSAAGGGASCFHSRCSADVTDLHISIAQQSISLCANVCVCVSG